MSLSHIKSALFGSALALASQTAMANKPLPCPTTSPIVDNLGIIQGATKQRVENRLRAIDSEKHHQVVLVTVDNLEEYGYDTTEKMARNFLNTCHVGYRGENTGVVVLYAKNAPVRKYWITPSSGVSGYFPDSTVQQIGRHSLEGCNEEDISCRLDDITGEIDKIIQKHFSDEQSVQKLKQSDKKFDEKKAAKETSELLNDLGLGAVVIVVLGGMGVGGNRIIKRNRRQALKRQIFELDIRFKAEKAKYPEWFIAHHTRDAERSMKELNEYSDDELNNVNVPGYAAISVRFKRNIFTVTEAIRVMEIEFQELKEKVQKKTDEVARQMIAVSTFQKSIEKEGFKFEIMEISSIPEGSNPDETLSLLDAMSNTLTEYESKLRTIPGFYQFIYGLDERIQRELASKKSEYVKMANECAAIYGAVNGPIDFIRIEKKVADFAQEFQTAYQEKDISKLTIISKRSESLFSAVSSAIDGMKQRIRWYNEIPSKVAVRQKQIQGIQEKSEYTENASKFAQKTGKRTFSGYNMGATLLALQGLLTFVTDSHSQKKNLAEIDKKLQEFDTEHSKMKEYIGLGAALAALIAAEIAEEIARQERQKREEERRRREAEEEEERRRRRRDEEEEERRNSSRRNSESEPSAPTWTSGGGGGGDGGGGGFD